MDFLEFYISLFVCFVVINIGDSYGQDFLFLLAQEWPPSTCKKFETEHRECDVPEQAKPWLIHGLWMEDGSYPHHQTENCKISQPYNSLYMKRIKDNMETYWPSISKSKRNENFWAHEWNVHGRCCTKCMKLSNQTKYFTEAINLRRNYDLFSLLRGNDIVPNDQKKYRIYEIKSVISEWFGKEVSLRCENIGNSSNLLRVFLCFDGSLQPADCPSKSSLYEEIGEPNQMCLPSVIYPAM